MSDRIATISGVALSPGVSKNNRRYTAEAVQRAHHRLKARLADPNGRPVVMRSFHPAGASDLDVTNIAGRLTSVSLGENGDLRFVGDIANTAAGRDVAALTTPEKPYLANVSIHGLLVGEAATDANGIETIDDVEIEALDFVTSPGVERARILSAVVAESDGRTVVTESAGEALVTLEAGNAPGNGKLPYGSDADYADPGYQKDKQKRYPLNTAKRVRAANAYLNVASNASKYTATQLKRMRGKIKSAAKKFGIDLAAENATLAAELTEVLEAYASSCLDNGQGSVNVSGYTNEPADLASVGARVALAAQAALAALDPDSDGDIDLAPDGGASLDDDTVCPNCSMVCDPTDNFCPACGAALPATETDDNAMEGAASTTESETSMSEAATPAPEGFARMTQGVASPHAGTQPTPVVEAAPAPPTAPVAPAPAETAPAPVAAVAPTLNEADHAAIAAKVLEGLKPVDPEAPASAAAAVPVTAEAAPAGVISVTPETVAEMIQKGIAEGLAVAKKELADETVALYRSGGRKGVVRPADESGNPKAIHEMTVEERETYANEAWAQVLNRAPSLTLP